VAQNCNLHKGTLKDLPSASWFEGITPISLIRVGVDVTVDKMSVLIAVVTVCKR